MGLQEKLSFGFIAGVGCPKGSHTSKSVSNIRGQRHSSALIKGCERRTVHHKAIWASCAKATSWEEGIVAQKRGYCGFCQASGQDPCTGPARERVLPCPPRCHCWAGGGYIIQCAGSHCPHHWRPSKLSSLESMDYRLLLQWCCRCSKYLWNFSFRIAFKA